MKNAFAVIAIALALVSSAFAKREKPTPIDATPEIIQRVAAAVPILRGFMRDPDSFVFESASIVARGVHVPGFLVSKGNPINDDIICLRYRSRNGFGGYGDSGSAVILLNGGSTPVLSKDRGEGLEKCQVGRFDAVTDITAEVKAVLTPPTKNPADKAEQAQQYADCLKLAVKTPSIVCKQ
jgi:hypothetical protein